MRKRCDWWEYHKWYVAIGAVLLWIAADLAAAALKARRERPDIQIAYVAETPLDDDLTALLEREFASFAADRNGDGKTSVRINAYIYRSKDATPDELIAQAATDVRLIGDIAAKESFLFLTDDADRLQFGYRILADAEGACPEEGDLSVTDKVIRLSETRVFPAIGSTEDMDFLNGFVIGRRCFSDRDDDPNRDAAEAFWNKLNPHAPESGA